MKNTMNKRILALALSIMMVLGLLPGVTPYAHAENCMEQHTYTNNYETDEYYHYLKCDVCGIFSDGDVEFHSDSDSNCICDVCKYVMHQIDELTDLGDGTHRGYCDLCSQTVTLEHVFYEVKYDTESHWYICDCGVESGDAPHTYLNECWYKDEEYHYNECDICSYYKSEGEVHNLTGQEGADQVCSTCGYIVHNYAWDQETFNEADHWVKCSVCENECWQSHSDGDDEDQKCDVCGLSMDCQHESESFKMYDGVAHWDFCEKCEADLSKRESHSFDEGCYYWDTANHYPVCEFCYYYLEAEGNSHVDENEDTYCDVCSYWIHNHNVGSDDWVCLDGKHYPLCDLCGECIEELGVACTDNNGDHVCDEKNYYMEWLCTDVDNNHFCDAEGCKAALTGLCGDTDNDHVCDICKEEMEWLCTDENGDIYCDTCGRNSCNHWFADEPVYNNDGTHKYTCGGCGTEIVEDCSVSKIDSGITTHTGFCSCGYEFPARDHTYDLGAYSMTGHWLRCSECNYMKWEAHTTSNVICPVCEMQVSECADVYVGGKGLKDGEYLDNNGNVSTTQPAGGYAYYSNGVLELNGYVYEGVGILWREYGEDDAEYASIYATTDLSLVLNGENSLKAVIPGIVEYEMGYGIAVIQNLTIKGDGSLTIQAENYGIYVYNGDLIINGDGSLTIQAEDYGINVYNGDLIIKGDGSMTIQAEVNGICMEYGDLTLESGTVSLGVSESGTGNYVGIRIFVGELIIKGGTLTVNSVNNGFDVNKGNLIIEGGTVTVVAEDCGLDCESTVTISGGELTVISRENFAIRADGEVTISGGVVIASGERGAFNTEPVALSNGTDAKLWYGDNESAALGAGEKNIDELQDNYSQMYVKIAMVQVVSNYTVTFNANGGVAIDPITVTYGEKYGMLPSSAITGLSGGDSNWYLVDEKGDVTDVKITRNSIVETSGDHMLFVKRKVLTPTLKITLEVPGAVSDGYQYYVPDNSERILTVTVNNQNTDILDYTYQWYKDGVAIEGATDAVLILDGNVSDAGTYKVKVTATLKDESGIIVTENTASAEKEQVVKIMHAANTLYYDANGGESGPSSNYTGGNEISVQNSKPTREGYIFGGWNTEADGTGESYDSGETYTFENDNGNGGCSVTLYAQWIKAYDVYVGGVQVTSANASDVLGDGKVSYDVETATLTLNDASINNADGIGIEATGDLTISGSGSVTGSTYGIYVEGMLSIASGSVIEMTGIENCALAVRDGILTDNIIVSVPKNYAMGSVGEEEYTTYGTYIEENDEYKFIPAKTVKFESGYVIYFNVGESMDYIEYQEIIAGGNVERPADPTLSGYTFGGWYTDEAYTEAYDFDEAVTEDLWLYAKWVPVTADDDNTSSDNTQTGNDTEENDNKPTDSAQTGDNSNLWLWVVLIFVSGGAVITLTAVDRKRRYTAKC